MLGTALGLDACLLFWLVCSPRTNLAFMVSFTLVLAHPEHIHAVFLVASSNSDRHSGGAIVRYVGFFLLTNSN